MASKVCKQNRSVSLKLNWIVNINVRIELRTLLLVLLVQLACGHLLYVSLTSLSKDTDWQRRARFNGIRSIRVVKLFRAKPDINVRIKLDRGCRLNLQMLLYFNITWSTSPEYKFINRSIIQSSANEPITVWLWGGSDKVKLPGTL